MSPPSMTAATPNPYMWCADQCCWVTAYNYSRSCTLTMLPPACSATLLLQPPCLCCNLLLPLACSATLPVLQSACSATLLVLPPCLFCLLIRPTLPVLPPCLFRHLHVLPPCLFCHLCAGDRAAGLGPVAQPAHLSMLCHAVHRTGKAPGHPRLACGGGGAGVQEGCWGGWQHKGGTDTSQGLQQLPTGA